MARRRRPPRAGALSELQPLRIAGQIATLQAIYYAAAVVLFVATTLIAGASFSFDIILGWDRVRGDTTQGWVMSFVWALDGALVMPIAIALLIVRSKLVPDFALTVHGLHLVATTVYTRSLPRHMLWWLTMAGSSALCVVLGVWACRHRELQSVFFGARPPAAGASSTANTAQDGGADDEQRRRLMDEEMGLGRDEAYEMDKLRSSD